MSFVSWMTPVNRRHPADLPRGAGNSVPLLYISLWQAASSCAPMEDTMSEAEELFERAFGGPSEEALRGPTHSLAWSSEGKFKFITGFHGLVSLYAGEDRWQEVIIKRPGSLQENLYEVRVSEKVDHGRMASIHLVFPQATTWPKVLEASALAWACVSDPLEWEGREAKGLDAPQEERGTEGGLSPKAHAHAVLRRTIEHIAATDLGRGDAWWPDDVAQALRTLNCSCATEHFPLQGTTDMLLVSMSVVPAESHAKAAGFRIPPKGPHE